MNVCTHGNHLTLAHRYQALARGAGKTRHGCSWGFRGYPTEAGSRILPEFPCCATDAGPLPAGMLHCPPLSDHPPAMRIIRVAIPVPLRQVFDYLPAADTTPEQYQRGQRVLAPFGRRQLAGIVVGTADQADVDEATLKPLLALWDGQALIPEEVLRLCEWAARYYHAPLGEVLAAALPVALRQQQQGHCLGEQAIRLTATGLAINPETLRRAPRQAALWQRLQAAPVTLVTLREEGFTSTVIRAVKERGLAEECLLETPPATRPSSPEPPLVPNSAQQAAVQAILQHPGQYQCFLLEGITGSGKTEVYLQAIAGVLDRGQQALVLVPEIGLAPQTVERFRRRFGTQVACYHSGLSEKERQASWHAAASGQARILIGTRSAVFLPLPEPGICIVDEEHDAAFKQQDGFRYHARDIAIKRAFDANIPVVLGSATPSSESLSHAQAQRYHHLHLPERAGHAALPDWRLIDMRQQRSEEGLSSMLLDAIRDTLHNGQQALVFINRRGYAPSLCCPGCGWQAQCPDCSVRMTLHRRPPGLRCHHCDHREPKPGRCPACQNPALMAVGAGTQRSEEVLQRHFPEFPVLR
ncbi:MAG: primosomal protein N', partial [Gammaproteobacteria bacterium]